MIPEHMQEDRCHVAVRNLLDDLNFDLENTKDMSTAMPP